MLKLSVVLTISAGSDNVKNNIQLCNSTKSASQWPLFGKIQH